MEELSSDWMEAVSPRPQKIRENTQNSTKQKKRNLLNKAERNCCYATYWKGYWQFHLLGLPMSLMHVNLNNACGNSTGETSSYEKLASIVKKNSAQVAEY